jgi:hypothetical protein
MSLPSKVLGMAYKAVGDTVEADKADLMPVPKVLYLKKRLTK